MPTRRASGLAALAVVLAIAGCSRDEAPQPSTPAATPTDSRPPAGQSAPASCDMSQDMSKMTAEEHRQMMERCQKENPSGAASQEKHEHPN